MQVRDISEWEKQMDVLSGRISHSSKRIQCMKSAQTRVFGALASSPPQGVSRVDWIVQCLNVK